jgi:hypothetical protein
MMFESEEDEYAVIVFGGFVMVILLGCVLMTSATVLMDVLMPGRKKVVIPEFSLQYLSRETQLLLFWIYSLNQVDKDGEFQVRWELMRQRLTLAEIGELHQVLSKFPEDLLQQGDQNHLKKLLSFNSADGEDDNLMGQIQKEFILYCSGGGDFVELPQTR